MKKGDCFSAFINFKECIDLVQNEKAFVKTEEYKEFEIDMNLTLIKLSEEDQINAISVEKWEKVLPEGYVHLKTFMRVFYKSGDEYYTPDLQKKKKSPPQTLPNDIEPVFFKVLVKCVKKPPWHFSNN